MKMNFHLTKYCYRVLALLLVTSAIASSSGCLPANPPNQSGGIRIEALEASLFPEFNLALFPMPNVPNRGRLLVRRSNNSTGTRSVFQGSTDAFGLSDYPDAITDAQWSVGIGPSTAPPCVETPFIEEVPLQGGVFVYFCHI
jgi:hypothetical protein